MTELTGPQSSSAEPTDEQIDRIFRRAEAIRRRQRGAWLAATGAVVMVVVIGAVALSSSRSSSNSESTPENFAEAPALDTALPIQVDRQVTTQEHADIGKDVIEQREAGMIADPGLDPVQTIPIDLTRDGHYSTFAPVPAGVNGAGITVAFPNDVDGEVNLRPVDQPLVERDGQTYYQMDLEVVGLKQAYPGFQGWVY